MYPRKKDSVCTTPSPVVLPKPRYNNRRPMVDASSTKADARLLNDELDALMNKINANGES